MRRRPVPRWDLIRLDDYVTMSVQFSRGCPFDCEFCDIVVMNGRVPRTKAPAQTACASSRRLRLAGWKDMVFIVDDNFIGNRKHAKELLRAIIEWRSRVNPDMGFLTEASVNLADHAELVRADGRGRVQEGVRRHRDAVHREASTNAASSRTASAISPSRSQTLQRAGLEVMGGFIVGFDTDRHDIFTRQFEFIQRSGVVTAMVGLLTALPQTALYQRLAREGRILERDLRQQHRRGAQFRHAPRPPIPGLRISRD